MAEEQDMSGPSLEPPRFLRRGKRRASAEVPAPATEIPTTVVEVDATPAEPTAPTRAAKPPKAPRTPRPARARRATGRTVDGRVASVVSGLVTGLVMVGLVALGFQGCQAVQGTTACGTGPGLILLVVIFALTVVAGRLLLTVSRVPDPGSTSFLAVGMTGVIALLFLIDVLDTWPMLIVIPVITAAAMLLSWWVTTTFVAPAEARDASRSRQSVEK